MPDPRPDPAFQSSIARVLRFLGRFVTWKSVVLSGVAAGGLMLVFVLSGIIDISADKPDGWLARTGLHYVFKSSMAFHSHGVQAPDDLAAPSRVLVAAQHFDMVCANCHGRPGFGQSVTALSMNPRPQYLPKVVGQFTDAELYRIVKHGVKYSAMPSWPTDARIDEVWSMVAFLRRLPTLDAKSYRAMTALPPTDGAAAGGVDETASLRAANGSRNTPPVEEFLYAAPAAGFADSTVHQTPFATCARCHGADGSGAASGGEAPNLTLQDANYLRAALRAYTTGARKSGFMQTIAAELSDQQIDDLANRYAATPAQSPWPRPESAAVIGRGEQIAREGIRSRALPACSNCHESDGARLIGAPHIAGQSETFLRRQLGAMRRGGRGSTGGWNPMPAEAHDLDDKDIAALAAYYSREAPRKAAAPPKTGAPRQATPDSPAPALQNAKAIFETRCVKCHVDHGRGDLQGLFPNLTLLEKTYAAQALFSMRTRARPNEQMTDVVDGLTLDQLSSLAAYVNDLSPQATKVKFDAVAAKRGEAVARLGITGRGVPACLSCHSAGGAAALPLIPYLQGQNAAYLSRRLENFALNYDVDRSALNPMPAIARKLTHQQRVDVANYFAASAPVGKAAAR